MVGLLLHGDTERSATLRHEVPIPIIDPFLYAEVDGRRYVLTSILEADRLKHALPDAELLDYFELGYKELVARGMSIAEASREVEARAVREIGIREAVVPGDFPVALADRLREDGVVLTVDEAAVELRRRAKTPAELDGIRAAQKAAEAGMAAAAELLARAEPSADGKLQLDGQPLSAEMVRETLRTACSENGAPCPPDVIVASVWQGYGHEPGSGPLPAGLPIHVDLWPRHEASGCWADMARVFVVGDPAPEHADRLAEMNSLVRQALEQAEAGVRPGVKGRELFDATCDLFESAGYATQRTTNDDSAEGFQHSLGHGVGLEVHEAPPMGLAGQTPLVPRDVLAIEPGLWDSSIGGVTFEDLVLVTEDGCELLTTFPYELAPQAR
jgi:Xaa-Pro aminopeptidase